jgi:hypothetical protein
VSGFIQIFMAAARIAAHDVDDALFSVAGEGRAVVYQLLGIRKGHVAEWPSGR